MQHKAYVYTELQIALPFDQLPWQRINEAIQQQPGFLDKTWFAGVGNQSIGGFYTFETIESALQFTTHYFPTEAKEFGVALTTRVFDAAATEMASREMNSPHYDGVLPQTPGAFVYTEVQAHVLPFQEAAPWRALNPVLKRQAGLLCKTWLSGIHTGTPGGLYGFDTIENARKFAIDYFPTEAAALNAAFTTRVFDAKPTADASRRMHSPYSR